MIDGRLNVRQDDLRRLLTSIFSGYAAVVVPGVFVLRVLADAGLSPGFTVLVEREGGTWSDELADEGKRYEAEYEPARMCQCRFPRGGDGEASPADGDVAGGPAPI